MYIKILFWGLYIIGVIFILSGAVNSGVSLYFMSIGFMVLVLWISKSGLNNKKLFYFSIFLIIFSIVVSHTQAKNPILFPIISGGYIEVLENGYQRTYDDGTGWFSLEEKEGVVCVGCGEIKYTKIKKGDIYKVLGVRIESHGFGTNISLVTEVGRFREYDYHPLPGKDKYIEVSKPVQACWADRLSILMSWPILPQIIRESSISEVTCLLGGT